MNNFYFLPFVYTGIGSGGRNTTVTGTGAATMFIAFLCLYGLSLSLYLFYFIKRLRNVDFEFRSFCRNWSELDWMACGCIASQCLKIVFLESAFTFTPIDFHDSSIGISSSTKKYLFKAILIDYAFFLSLVFTSTYFIIYLVTVSDGLQIYKHMKIWGVKILPLPGLKVLMCCELVGLTIPVVLICTRGLESTDAFKTFLFYEFIQYALGSLFVQLPLLLYFGLPILDTLKKGLAAKKTASNRKIPIMALEILIYTTAIFGFVLNAGGCTLISLSNNETLNASEGSRNACIIIINLILWFATSFFSVFLVFRACSASSGSSRSNSSPSPLMKHSPSAESKAKSKSSGRPSPPALSGGNHSSSSTSIQVQMNLPYFSVTSNHQVEVNSSVDGCGINVLLLSENSQTQDEHEHLELEDSFRQFDSASHFSPFSSFARREMCADIDSRHVGSFLEMENVERAERRDDLDCSGNLRFNALDSFA